MSVYAAWVYPAAVLLTQIVPPAAAWAGAGILLFTALFARKIKPLLILCGLTGLGFCLWSAFTGLLVQLVLTQSVGAVAGRFGLLGYLAVFFIWARLDPPRRDYFRLGGAGAEIRFPFIWAGKKEVIWRFILIFSAICLVPICLFAILVPIAPRQLVTGLAFTLVNSTLEELLWRGFILTRVLDISDERNALIVTALAFGGYHLSLGFPIWACLIFAAGGYYMGGAAITSKGLLAPWMMHVMVNLIFVFAGWIG